MEKQNKGKKNKWLSRWVNKRTISYLFAAAASTLLFATVLVMGITKVIEQQKLWSSCEHILEVNTAAYEENKTDYEDRRKMYELNDKRDLAMIAVRVSTAARVEDLPAMSVFTDFNGDAIWLLNKNGKVLRGPDLPGSLTRAELQQLLTRNNRIEKENAYTSYATPLGVLVIETFCLTDNTSIYLTSSNHDDDRGFSFWVAADGLIYGWPGAKLDIRPLVDLCPTPELLSNEEQCERIVIDGVEYRCMTRTMENGDILVAAIPQSELAQSIAGNVQIPIVLFAAAALAVLIYALIMRGEANTFTGQWNELTLAGGQVICFNRGLLGRLESIALLLIAVLGSLSWLSMTLTAYAQYNLHATHYLKDISMSAPYYSTREEQEFTEFHRLCTGAIYGLSNAVAIQPAMLQEENLGKFADACTIRGLRYHGESYNIKCIDARVYDAKGNMLATGKDILSGERPSLSATTLSIMEEAEADGTYIFMYDAGAMRYTLTCGTLDGTGRYVLLFFEAPSRFAGWLPEFGETLDQVQQDEFQLVSCAKGQDMGDGGTGIVVRVVEEEDGNVRKEVLNPMEQMNGTYPTEDSLDQLDVNALRENYAGDQIIDETSYYINTTAYRLPSTKGQAGITDKYWLIYAVPSGSVAQNRIPVMTHILLLGGGILLLLGLVGSVRWGAPVVAGPATFTDKANRRTKTRNGHRVNGPIMGWGTKSGWGSKTPEEKFLSALGNLTILSIATMTVLGMTQGAFQDGTVLRYIISGNWDRDFNIFSCTYIVIVLAACFSISWVLRGLLSYLAGNLGPRSETMGRLFTSLIKYAAYIAAGLYLLYDFGVNTSVLLGSVGLLTLVLSPTLNMLLGDVSAGIFIVFEDEYRVGDVVRINGFRGVVLEITLRTTSLEDLMGNVKVFNNSKITEVENLSQEYTTAVILVGVPYEEPIARIENILRDELPKLPETLPNIVGSPTYEGIDQFGDSGVIIRIHFLVREEQRPPMERRFRHELKEIFDRRGINIPYTQIVLHDGDAPADPAPEPKKVEEKGKKIEKK